MFNQTFYGYARGSTTGTIPAGFFNTIDFTNVTSLPLVFSNTFNSYAYNNTAPLTDINAIWGNANFAGTVTAANAGGPTSGTFYGTFSSMRSLTGAAQTFINNKLGGVIPDVPAQTFTNTQITDSALIDPNWR